jgi:hypothetical protein
MDATLFRRFGEAGLTLRPATAPMKPWLPRSFQLEIRRVGRAEHFRVWPGVGVRAEVLSLDRKLRQLVLRVREAETETVYLLGVDERRLYIERLVGGGGTSKARRLGEWRFVPAGSEERSRLDALVDARRAVILLKEPLGPGEGAPVADELLRVPAPSQGTSRAPGMALFVRGAVGPLRFRAWTSARAAEGTSTYWIDAIA